MMNYITLILKNFEFLLCRHDEQQYLDAIQEIIERGSLRSNRTGVDTKAIFGMQQRYNLRESKGSKF